MCTTLVLTLLDFTKTFVLECDDFGKGIKVGFMQEGRPLAFTNKQLYELHLGKSTYEKEKMTILHAIWIFGIPTCFGNTFSLKLVNIA